MQVLRREAAAGEGGGHLSGNEREAKGFVPRRAPGGGTGGGGMGGGGMVGSAFFVT